MHDLSQNTLAIYLANPMLDNVDFSKISVKDLGTEIEAFTKTNKMAKPETDALTFYMLNHGFHLIRNKYSPLEPLPQEVGELVEQHLIKTSEIAKRLFYYIVVICVEEGRYVHEDAQFEDFIRNRYGEDFYNYVKNDFSTDKSRSLTSFKNLKMNSGDFLSAMTTVFAFGKWNPGYGGKGWTGIAQLAANLTTGNCSFERMADNAFSLCHNNGSMFNKGHLYHCYSHFIYKILDIQDSGQIPKWVGENLKSEYVNADLKDMYKKFAKFFPDEFTGPVDSKLIKDSSEKREKQAAKKAQQLQAIWANQGHQHTQNNRRNMPGSKLDEELIDIYKSNKLI